ncbi:MAG: Flp pilus assembly protein CpaB [Bryobacterales bacterium]|nr:Flp pilus assembly protein CpaB [Bryobacterales bacterium]
MKKSLAPILIVAFTIAVVCTAIFYSLVAGRLATSANASSTTTVLVAARGLERGKALGVLDVKATPWNIKEVPEGALRSADQVEGLTALADIAAGEPVTASRVASKRNGAGLGIPAGMRAISVQVHDSSGVVALLKPGHRVDVQAVYTRSGASVDAELRTVLENVEVLRINAAPEPAPGRPALPVATLLVTPSDADLVGLADAIARVRLVLRNPLDEERVRGPVVAVGGMMQGGRAAAQSPVYRPAPVRSAPPVAVAAVAPAPGGLSLASAEAANCNPPKSKE